MSWEILHDENQNKAAFYCNAVGVAFGPVFSTDEYDLNVNLFYKWWKVNVRTDPRLMENTDIQSKLEEWERLQKNPHITCSFMNKGDKVVLEGRLDGDLDASIPIYQYHFNEELVTDLEELVEEINESILEGTYSAKSNQFTWNIIGLSD